MTNIKEAEYVIVQHKCNEHHITFISLQKYENEKENWNFLDYADYYTDACRKTDRWNEKLTGTWIV